MRQAKSCGVVVYRAAPRPGVLLLRHAERYDLPKGHMLAHETEHACALRELAEETGLALTDVELDDTFRFEETYRTRYKRFGGAPVAKTVVLFLARLRHAVTPRVTEHASFVWVDWPPPPALQARTIDPLFRQLAAHLPCLDPAHS